MPLTVAAPPAGLFIVILPILYTLLSTQTCRIREMNIGSDKIARSRRPVGTASVIVCRVDLSPAHLQFQAVGARLLHTGAFAGSEVPAG